MLSVDGFAGPLDWLLEMARTRKINLARLPIGALIAQFADALAAALAGSDPRAIDRWAGWTVMAATLTELWSRLLLPADPAAARAAEAEAEALRRRLLARRPQLGRDVFPRGRAEASESDRGSDLTEVLRACPVVLQVPEVQAAAYRPQPPPLWRVTDALPHIRRFLAMLPDGTPLAALLPPLAGDDPGRVLRCRAAVASTLVAGLGLARGGALTLAQDAGMGRDQGQPGRGFSPRPDFGGHPGRVRAAGLIGVRQPSSPAAPAVWYRVPLRQQLSRSCAGFCRRESLISPLPHRSGTGAESHGICSCLVLKGVSLLARGNDPEGA